MQQIAPTEQLKRLDQLPVIELPNSYATDLPSFHARTAIELGPVFRRELPPEIHHSFGRWMVYLVGPELNRIVMQTHRDHFSHEIGWSRQFGPLIARGLFMMDGWEHDRHRKMINPAFTTAYMQKYLPIMRAVIEERSRAWGEQDSVDLWAEARKITFDVAAEALLGFERGLEVDRLRELFYLLFHEQTTPLAQSTEQVMQAVVGLRRQIDPLLMQSIHKRRMHPTDDILGFLVSARDETGESLTDKQVLGHLHVLLLAGHETTTTLAAWTLYLLALNPEYLEPILDELSDALAGTHGEITFDLIRSTPLLGNAINEVGRLYSPVGYVPRGVVKDVELGGYLIPAGTYVLLSLAGCHRLPNVFQDPDTFNPDRFTPPRDEAKRTPYALVPFGGGPRICVGINFAQVEIKILVAHVLSKYSLEPVGPQNVEHAFYAPTATLQSGLHVRVRPPLLRR